MELRHLRYFVTVAEERHFGRAAALLNITQPTLSQQIQSLEDELGVQLLHRTKRHVELTYAGQLMIERARAILANVEQATRVVRQAGQGMLGRIVLGYVDATLYTLFPEIVYELHERYPEVDLILDERSPDDQVRAVLTGLMDIGILYLPITNHAALEYEVLVREPTLVALPANHRLAGCQQVALWELADERFVLPARQLAPQLHDQMMRSFQVAGFMPQIAQEASSKQAVVAFVAAGLGVTLLPASVARLQSSNVVYVVLSEPMLTLNTAVVWRRDNPSPIVQNVLVIARKVARVYNEQLASAITI